MASTPAACRPGLRDAGVRRVDNMGAGFVAGPERLSGRDRVRSDVPSSQVRYRYHPVVAWAALAVASASGGAAITLLATGGHF